jgi:hypothetical protein
VTSIEDAVTQVLIATEEAYFSAAYNRDEQVRREWMPVARRRAIEKGC